MQNLQLGALIAIILGAITWLAVGSTTENKSYFKTVNEVLDMGNQAQEKRLRVGGDVVAGSVTRQGSEVRFNIAFADRKIPVVYNGIDPLPDTFKDGAQALCDGKMGSDGVFHANKIQAKCASKYVAKPPAGLGKPTWERKPAT